MSPQLRPSHSSVLYIDGERIDCVGELKLPREKIRINPMVLLDIKTPSFYGTPAEWCDL